VDSIVTLHPGARPWVIGSDARRPVLFTCGGDAVGVVMPLNTEKVFGTEAAAAGTIDSLPEFIRQGYARITFLGA
jgi:hypothetical protein